MNEYSLVLSICRERLVVEPPGADDMSWITSWEDLRPPVR